MRRNRDPSNLRTGWGSGSGNRDLEPYRAPTVRLLDRSSSVETKLCALAHTVEDGPRFRRTSEPAESAGTRSRASAAPEIGNPLTGSHFSGAARLHRLARRVLSQVTAGERQPRTRDACASKEVPVSSAVDSVLTRIALRLALIALALAVGLTVVTAQDVGYNAMPGADFSKHRT